IQSDLQSYMTSEDIYHLPLNMYVIILGIGLFIFMLSLIFCCYIRDELGVCPCSHAFHKKCLLKWLEIRSVCPMCNKPICRSSNLPHPTPLRRTPKNHNLVQLK
uniref:cullin-RING-type E3 NEDD8 transferase n=1 Tax=Hucho hucho TaxID=62062 RepID=A0A4W5P643_9TELE